MGGACAPLGAATVTRVEVCVVISIANVPIRGREGLGYEVPVLGLTDGKFRQTVTPLLHQDALSWV